MLSQPIRRVAGVAPCLLLVTTIVGCAAPLAATPNLEAAYGAYAEGCAKEDRKQIADLLASDFRQTSRDGAQFSRGAFLDLWDMRFERYRDIHMTVDVQESAATDNGWQTTILERADMSAPRLGGGAVVLTQRVAAQDLWTSSEGRWVLSVRKVLDERVTADTSAPRTIETAASASSPAEE